MTRFGDFAPLCHQVPSYPWCNLFYHQVCPSPLSVPLALTPRQIQHHDSGVLQGVSADAVSAPVGVNPECGILRVGHNGSIANVANIVACALSIIFTLLLIVWTTRRRAAVGESLTSIRRYPVSRPSLPSRCPCIRASKPPVHLVRRHAILLTSAYIHIAILPSSLSSADPITNAVHCATRTRAPHAPHDLPAWP
ncbi:hypothetical protein OH76DRAFT_489826 [Lentinus brumalis]|uniref:Uncharacterized protein n=1 Tax=Lentinus brumalis TaxID=2498619 RepID=A0A371CHZ7_9APHY|nr:hypothetical protein OH76DRAFT_489826 [Polyporus brumalis]